MTSLIRPRKEANKFILIASCDKGKFRTTNRITSTSMTPLPGHACLLVDAANSCKLLVIKLKAISLCDSEEKGEVNNDIIFPIFGNYELEIVAFRVNHKLKFAPQMEKY
jgi:hypothetical protein